MLKALTTLGPRIDYHCIEKKKIYIYIYKYIYIGFFCVLAVGSDRLDLTSPAILLTTSLCRTPSRCSASPRQKDPSRRLFQHRHRCRCSRGSPSQPFCHRFCSRGWYQDPEPIRQGHVGSCSQLTLY